MPSQNVKKESWKNLASRKPPERIRGDSGENFVRMSKFPPPIKREKGKRRGGNQVKRGGYTDEREWNLNRWGDSKVKRQLFHSIFT